MVRVDVVNYSGGDLDMAEIRSLVEKVLFENDEQRVCVSVAVVDGKKMRELVAKYYEKDNDEHPVLSFANRETKTFPRADGLLEELGEIILNSDYSKGGSLGFWAEHGTLHLLGVHHD